MIGMRRELEHLVAPMGWDVHWAEVVQTLGEDELIELVPRFDGWIIGDDPATARVLAAGREGRLRAAVKWGVGVDNVDLRAASELGLPVTNTPRMFGAEVADVALSYVIALARETFVIDRGVRRGEWPKPRGISLGGKRVAVVGYGDIGRNVVKRLLACDMLPTVYDPMLSARDIADGASIAKWPAEVEAADFIVLTCALNDGNRHMIDASALARAKAGVRIVNVSRGPLIDEAALADALQSKHVHSAALDVMEVEPLPADSRLRSFERCIFGSHNGSNTSDAVRRASAEAVERLHGMLAEST